MVMRFCGLIFIGQLCGMAVSTVEGQSSRIVLWNDGDLSANSVSLNTYHPEPIIFVHGITASRLNWEKVIQNLGVTNQWFGAYHYVQETVVNAYESANPPVEDYLTNTNDVRAIPLDDRNQYREIEKPYLHTFNYGRHAKRKPLPVLPLDTFAVPTNVTATIRARVSRQSHDLVEWNLRNGALL
jgi:hypothetical protein